jgi:hypothetical protein
MTLLIGKEGGEELHLGVLSQIPLEKGTPSVDIWEKKLHAEMQQSHVIVLDAF